MTQELIGIEEAARLLGKTKHGMRKLVDRSRRAASGKPVRGAVIRFCQDGKGGTILFRREWIEEYLGEITVDLPPTTLGKPPPERQQSRLSWESLADANACQAPRHRR